MKKEKRTRGIPYLDSIDLEILEFLDKQNYKKNITGWTVLDLVNNMNISHISLKPHLDKLLRLQLILLINLNYKCEKKERLGFATIRDYNKTRLKFKAYKDIEEKEKIEQDIKNFNCILDCLKDIRQFEYSNTNGELINIDLRSTDTQDKYLIKRVVKKNISRKK